MAYFGPTNFVKLSILKFLYNFMTYTQCHMAERVHEYVTTLSALHYHGAYMFLNLHYIYTAWGIVKVSIYI